MVTAIILSLIFFSFLLLKSAELVIVALRRISKQTKTGVFALSAIILALGTSLPELFVGITSAMEKSSNLTLGVILGSNIANISLVAGLSALIAGKVRIHSNFFRKDILIALVAGVIPLLLLLDGKLTRVDGLILIVIYLAYASSFFRARFIRIAEEHKKESYVYRFFRRFNHVDTKITKEIGKLFVGVALLLFCADTIVKISTFLAVYTQVPVFVIGLVVIAIGTSLPELGFSLRSLEDGEPSMFFGNLLGSTIVNSTLVVGITALIYPIEGVSVVKYVPAAVVFLLVFTLFWIFIRTKHRLDRWEAAILLGIYFSFIIYEFF
jgi:cation:H+ antiporter